MDLPLVSASPSLEAPAPSRDGGHRGKSTRPKASDSSPPAGKEFSDALVGPGEAPKTGPSEQKAPTQGHREAPDSAQGGMPVSSKAGGKMGLLGIQALSGGAWTLQPTDAPDPDSLKGAPAEEETSGSPAVREAILGLGGQQSETGGPAAKGGAPGP